MNNTLSQTDWKRLESMTDEDIDTSDIPDLNEAFFRQAQVQQAYQQTVTMELDSDLIEWLNSKGQNYQVLCNALLRNYIQNQQQ